MIKIGMIRWRIIMEENENKIKAELWNNGKYYLAKHKDEEVVLHKLKFDGLLYARCHGCGYTTYFYVWHRNKPEIMIDRYSLERFMEHKNTCAGIEALDNLDELIETVSQNKMLEVLLVKEIVKAIYSVATAIYYLDK